jgi:predicted transcriptional regulator
MTKRGFGELELSILHILKSGKRMTVKEVHQRLGEQENKYNTIMTVMSRLAEKKRIARERVGLQYEYWIISSEEKPLSLLAQFKQKLFGVKTAEMVSYLIDSAEDISAEEFNEMEKMLEKARQKRNKLSE